MYSGQPEFVLIACLPLEGDEDNLWPALAIVHISFIKGDRELQNVPILAVLASGKG